MTITIPAEFDGRVLRSYLKFTLMISTSALSRMKKDERGILVNGQRVTVRYTLHTGDVLEIADRDTPATASERVIPADLPLHILYEDENVIALNKPPHMPTHPSHGHLEDTLANALAFRYQQAAEPFVFRPLGRLDRNTSGVVIVGKTRAASGALGHFLLEHRVTKRYVALLNCPLPVDGLTHTIDAAICRADVGIIMRTTCENDRPGADEAHTRYRVLASDDQFSLVLAEPVTGRTHQLRVHFAHIGHPIVGDDLYGDASNRIERHALHALSLSVPMPFARAMGETPAILPMDADPGANKKKTSVDAIDPSSFSAPHRPRNADRPGADALIKALWQKDPSTPINQPTPDGFLHTWAPLPPDMASVVDALFPGCMPATDHPTVTDLYALIRQKDDSIPSL